MTPRDSSGASARRTAWPTGTVASALPQVLRYLVRQYAMGAEILVTAPGEVLLPMLCASDTTLS